MFNFGGQTCWRTNSRRLNRYKIRYQNVVSWFKVNFGISWFLAPSKTDFTFLIWNRHWTCRFQSKFNHLSVIKACERPWNFNFSNSDSTSDLDNDRRFTASSWLQRTRIGILWLGKEYKPEVLYHWRSWFTWTCRNCKL